MHAQVFQSCLTLCNPMDCSHKAPLSMGFSRQEYWSGCPSLLQGIFLTQEMNLCLRVVGRFFTTELSGKCPLYDSKIYSAFTDTVIISVINSFLQVSIT